MNDSRAPVSPIRRRRHEHWLRELTGLPTVAGHERQVTRWIRRWIARRPRLRLRVDAAGNLLLTASRHPRSNRSRPVFFTAHLDHPGFVVRRVLNAHDVQLEFRGGVKSPYFVDAAIDIFDRRGRGHQARVVHYDDAVSPFPLVFARTDDSSEGLRAGDLGRWRLAADLPLPRVDAGRFHAHACDDLAGVAAALSALDVVSADHPVRSAGVLLTRAEEIGFVGAVEACRHRTLPADARVICLETSRSYADSPVGAGPIVRVGDRTSIFTASLTNRLSAIAARYADEHPGFAWQRKLMIGGTCEATAFGAYGYEAACLCLALGNYHNMVDLERVEGGAAPARVGPEVIALEDYHGLVELLVHAVRTFDDHAPGVRERLDALVERHRDVLRST